MDYASTEEIARRVRPSSLYQLLEAAYGSDAARRIFSFHFVPIPRTQRTRARLPKAA